jgi:hypothetical protein
MSTCSNSTARTARIFPAISPVRPRGVVERKRSTPYRRSKPVEMPCPVNAVDMAHSARMPGTATSMRLVPEAVQQWRHRQADHGQQRHHDREDQLLAVSEHCDRFVLSLQQDPAQQRRGPPALGTTRCTANSGVSGRGAAQRRIA